MIRAIILKIVADKAAENGLTIDAVLRHPKRRDVKKVLRALQYEYPVMAAPPMIKYYLYNKIS